MTSGSTNVRFVTSPRRTSVAVASADAVIRLLQRRLIGWYRRRPRGEQRDQRNRRCRCGQTRQATEPALQHRYLRALVGHVDDGAGVALPKRPRAADAARGDALRLARPELSVHERVQRAV